jgi:ABC-type transport system involved in cytochrome bd biosynthesis fused ATPase/permease subunit
LYIYVTVCIYISGLTIGLSIASGPALLLLVLGTILVLRKIKQHKTKALKQKYFKQNRGQLLQQLVSQNADIAESMIILLELISNRLGPQETKSNSSP